MDYPRRFLAVDEADVATECIVEDFEQLQFFLTGNYPMNTIIEIVKNSTVVPIIVHVEAKMKQETKTPVQIEDVVEEVFREVGSKDSKIGSSANARVSYQWDEETRILKIHIISPCKLEKFSDQFNRRVSQALVSLSKNFTRPYVSVVPKLGKKKKGYSLESGQCEIFYHMKDYSPAIIKEFPTSFFGNLDDEVEGEVITTCSDGVQVGREVVKHYILANAPKDTQIQFFMDMVGEWREHKDLFIDVAYTECGLGIHDTLAYKLVGTGPRPDGIRRTVRSLRWLARRQFTAKYIDWMLTQFQSIAQECNKGTITDQAFHQMFALYAEPEFFSLNEGGGSKSPLTLYYFKNYWRKDTDGRHMGICYDKFLTEFLPSHFKPYMYDRKLGSIYEEMMNKLGRLTHHRGSRVQFIDATISLLNEDIFMDVNPRVIACENVVIELTDSEAIARVGRPEDFVSMSTMLHYREYTEEECRELHSYMEKMFVDEDLRQFMYRSFSSLLYGGCPEKAFQIWYGSANNGKSKLLDWLEKALGNYFGRFSSASMNENKEGSATSPELNQLVGKRAAANSEIQPGTKMDTKIIKGFTGGDPMNVRGLYKDPRRLDPMFHVIIACNFVPIFKGLDTAMRIRIVLVPFDSTFDDDAPDDYEEQVATRHFKADPQFKEKLPKLAPMLLYQMVKGYSDYLVKGLKNYPPAIVNLCQAYWDEANFYSRFLNEVMIFSPESSCRFDEIYGRFCLWLSQKQLENVIRPVAKGLLENEVMGNKNYQVKIMPDKWVGCRLRVA